MKKHSKSTSNTFAGVAYPRPFQSKNPYFVYFTDNTLAGTEEAEDFENKRAKYAERELQQAKVMTNGSWKAVPSSSSGNAIIPTMPE